MSLNATQIDLPLPGGAASNVTVTNFPNPQNVTGSVALSEVASVSGIVAIVGTVSTDNATEAATGSTAPLTASLIGAVDPNGKIQTFKLDSSGNLFITGSMTAIVTDFPATQSITGTVAISGIPTITGSVSVLNTVNVTGSLKLSEIATVTGSITVPNSLTGSMSVLNTVSVTGSLKLSEIATVTGSITVPNTVNVSVTNSPTVTGSVSVLNTVNVTGSLKLSEIATVTGSVTVPNNVTVVQTTAANLNATVTGSVGISGTPTITGSVTVPNTVTITGSLKLSEIATVTGSITVPNVVTVTGSLKLSETANVSVTNTPTIDKLPTRTTASVLLNAALLPASNGFSQSLGFDTTNFDHVTLYFQFMSGSGAGSQLAFYVEESPDQSTYYKQTIQDGGSLTYNSGVLRTTMGPSLVLMQSGTFASNVTASFTYKFTTKESKAIKVDCQDIGASSNQGTVTVTAVGSR